MTTATEKDLLKELCDAYDALEKIIGHSNCYCKECKDISKKFYLAKRKSAEKLDRSKCVHGVLVSGWGSRCFRCDPNIGQAIPQGGWLEDEE